MAARSIIGCARPGWGAARCAQGRPPDYLDFGKKLFSLLCFRREPVPSTMAAAVGMPAASSRADAAGLAPPAHLAARALLATDSQNNGFNARRHDNHEQATDRSPLLLSLAGIAAAQSSVTLYGIVDAGVTYRSNERVGSAGAYTGHSSVEPRPATCPAAAGDQGFRGPRRRDARAVRPRERLRHHERHVGQGGRQFGRQAFVGLGSDRYGTVTLGRQYTSLDDFVAVGPSSYIGGFGAHPGDIDDLDQTARVDSSIKYTSANYSGFTFGALYGFGSQPGSMKQRNTWSVGAAYAAGRCASASVTSGRTTARRVRPTRRPASGRAPTTGCSTRRSTKAMRARNRSRSSRPARPTTSGRPSSA